MVARCELLFLNMASNDLSRVWNEKNRFMSQCRDDIFSYFAACPGLGQFYNRTTLGLEYAFRASRVSYTREAASAIKA